MVLRHSRVYAFDSEAESAVQFGAYIRQGRRWLHLTFPTIIGSVLSLTAATLLAVTTVEALLRT